MRPNREAGEKHNRQADNHGLNPRRKVLTPIAAKKIKGETKIMAMTKVYYRKELARAELKLKLLREGIRQELLTNMDEALTCFKLANFAEMLREASSGITYMTDCLEKAPTGVGDAEWVSEEAIPTLPSEPELRDAPDPQPTDPAGKGETR